MWEGCFYCHSILIHILLSSWVSLYVLKRHLLLLLCVCVLEKELRKESHS